MPKKTPDWQIEDDATESPAVAPQAAPVAPVEETIGEEVSPAPVAVVVVDEKLPDNFADAIKLVQSLSKFARLQPNPTPEQVAGHSKLIAARKLAFELQQGLPSRPTIAGEAVGLSVSDRLKWTLLARQNPDVKKLLAAYDAAVKENAELKELLK